MTLPDMILDLSYSSTVSVSSLEIFLDEMPNCFYFRTICALCLNIHLDNVLDCSDPGAIFVHCSELVLSNVLDSPNPGTVFVHEFWAAWSIKETMLGLSRTLTFIWSKCADFLQYFSDILIICCIFLGKQ